MLVEVILFLELRMLTLLAKSEPLFFSDLSKHFRNGKQNINLRAFVFHPQIDTDERPEKRKMLESVEFNF